MSGKPNEAAFEDITILDCDEAKTKRSDRRGYKGFYFPLSATPPKGWEKFLKEHPQQAATILGSTNRKTTFDTDHLIIEAESVEACKEPVQNAKVWIENANTYYKESLKTS